MQVVIFFVFIKSNKVRQVNRISQEQCRTGTFILSLITTSKDKIYLGGWDKSKQPWYTFIC